jgi:hypothetical protein
MIGAILSFRMIALEVAHAQVSTGTIEGRILDPSGAAISGAHIAITNRDTGAKRSYTSTAEGDYSAPTLQAGVYEVSAEASGFERLLREAIVETGTTTTADFPMRVGPTTQNVTVESAAPLIQYDSASIGAVVTRRQIEDLPLNGRNFLELAKLEPGVQPLSHASNNRTLVPVLGAPGGASGRGTRVTVDGGSIMAIGNGGAAMGFSQELVQEFQVSTVNFDLATGITDSGAVNVVTRSGGNDLHGAAFYFFRDHHLSAYPALNRNPADPDPFFQRRQFGGALGGRLRRDRVFFFGSWERNEQRAVMATTLVGSDFAQLSSITPTPLFGDQFSLRVDARISSMQTLFLRYSHDGSRAFGPSTLNVAGPLGMPSNWTRQFAWADQAALGFTSTFTSNLVNDFRFSYFFISSSELPPSGNECPGCLGVGAPEIDVAQAGLFLGNSAVSYNLGRRWHLNDSVTWQRGPHRARFGVDWEHNRGGLTQWFNEPATISLFSPSQVRQYNALPQTQPGMRIPLPTAFRTVDDILQLPLQTANVAVGDPRVPQNGGGLVRNWNTLRLYVQDTWQLPRRLTVIYGLGWSADGNLNYDLTKPPLLRPILGADGLGPTQKRWSNFSPALGVAWAPSRDGKTVIRAGAGIFYDFLFGAALDAERAALGPPGLGRQSFQVLNFTGAPTLYTGADLLAALPGIRASLSQSLENSDSSLDGIQVTKQFLPALGALYPEKYSTPAALHADVGVQREIARDFVLSADFAYRRFIHLGMSGDMNHFNSIHGPAVPLCTSVQRSDPLALCSLGPITVQQSIGHATYTGLLVRAGKHFSHDFQFLGSYAYSNNTGTNSGSGFNLNNWAQNTGPLGTDFTQIVNLAGVIQLPLRFALGLNFSYSSAPPFSAFVGGIDFDGDGTTNDLLPGTHVNQFNRGLGRSDLAQFVKDFNRIYAGTFDSHNRVIPTLTVPASYSFGDSFQSLDLRLSRSFVLRDRWSLLLAGDAFNAYNAANLSGFSGDLTSPAFGQPTSRVTQVFGSGGPRAFQLEMRISF